MLVGRVREIWRYPVKSMQGERLERSPAVSAGLPGDRGWALRDERAGEIRGAKHLPLLMQCAARCRTEPADGRMPEVDIVLPDGSTVGSDAPDVNARLSALLGRPVSLWRLQPPADRRHYRRAERGAALMGRVARIPALRPWLGTAVRWAGLDGPARALFAREPDEPLPDFSTLPPELFEFTSPPGTYFDAFPYHLLTTASLDFMAALEPAPAWDARRFRPNILIHTQSGAITPGSAERRFGPAGDETASRATARAALVEAGWSGRTLRIGTLHLRCEIPTVRCGMTTHAQQDLPRDPHVLRAIVRHADQNLGTYASAIADGSVTIGDGVELE